MRLRPELSAPDTSSPIAVESESYIGDMNESSLIEPAFTLREIQKAVGTSRQTLLRELKEKRLRGYRIGKTWRIPVSSWEEFMNRSTNLPTN